MLQPCKDVAPRLCTIVQCNWPRDDECSAAFFFQRSKRSKRVDSSAGRAPRAQNPGKHDPDGNHLPFDSQSAQYLFSSSASKELRTAWYLSTSFTDLPVIILLHHHHQHNSSCGLCRLLPNEPLTKKKKESVSTGDLLRRPSSSSSSPWSAEFASRRWDDCLSTNQHAAYSR